MTDIKKIRQTQSKDDGGEWEDWPYPTLEIESVVTGDLRARILAKTGRPDDGCTVTLIETEVSGGYSEYTQEDECTISIQVGPAVLWKHEYGMSRKSSLQRFMQEFA